MKNKIVIVAVLTIVGVISWKRIEPWDIEMPYPPPLSSLSPTKSIVGTDLPKARTGESFENEFRTASETVLRNEVKVIDAVLNPLIKIGNQRPLTETEHLAVTAALRKRQAILGILVDRQIRDMQARVNP